jgi:hypothetical protein
VKEPHLKSLLCEIGFGILRDPVGLPCQHTFCRLCIENISQSKGVGTCPICYETWSKEQLANKVEISEMINQETVKCPQCDWSGQYQAYDQHSRKACKNALVTCKYNCGVSLSRQYIPKHEESCSLRAESCKNCSKNLASSYFKLHEQFCPERILSCPICNKNIKVYDVPIHTRQCHEGVSYCIFNFAGCSFASGDKVELEEHYRKYIDKHMEIVCNVLSVLQSKIKAIEERSTEEEKRIAAISSTMRPVAKLYPIKWSTGGTKISGNKKQGWSFYLSNSSIPGNFQAKIKVLELGKDKNSWKVCVGLFNSLEHQVGSWDRHKNGWGYILGTGCVIYTSPAVPYGESVGNGDYVFIEYKDGTISFYKNGRTPGPAFKGVMGPFYLAVALSDASHVIELIEVAELIH